LFGGRWLGPRLLIVLVLEASESIHDGSSILSRAEPLGQGFEVRPTDITMLGELTAIGEPLDQEVEVRAVPCP
jgi:hypothetical protein